MGFQLTIRLEAATTAELKQRLDQAETIGAEVIGIQVV